MKTMSIADIKEKLISIYNKCEILERYHINTSFIKSEINDIDSLCDNASESNNIYDSNVAIKGDDKFILNRFNHLESTVNDYLSAVHIFESIKGYNDNLSREELSNLVGIILNDLLSYERSTIRLEEFDLLYPTLYKLIKMEFKYSGYSHILNFIRNSKLDESKIDDLFLLDYSKYFKEFSTSHMVNNIVLQDYSLYDKALLIISLTESGYLDKVAKELDSFKTSFDNISYTANELEENIKSNDKIKRKNIKNKILIQKTIIPAILSLSMLITANMLARTKINEKTTSYGQTTQTYDTMLGSDEEYSYGNNSVGDTTITVYNEIHDDGTRVIKTFEFNDSDFDITSIDDFDPNSMDFTKSEYKFDLDANYESLEEFKKASQITEINKLDVKINYFIKIMLHLLISIPTVIADMIVALADNYTYETSSSGPRTILSLLIGLRYYLGYIRNEIEKINYKYNYKNTKESKAELKKLKKQLDNLNKEYKLAYEKYLYIEGILIDHGYKRQLKRGK